MIVISNWPYSVLTFKRIWHFLNEAERRFILRWEIIYNSYKVRWWTHRRYSDIRGQESLVDATPLELFDSQAVFEFFKKSFDLFCQFAWVTISLTRGKFLFLYSLCSWMNENDIMGKLNKKGRRIKNHFILPSGIAMDGRWVW